MGVVRYKREQGKRGGGTGVNKNDVPFTGGPQDRKCLRCFFGSLSEERMVVTSPIHNFKPPLEQQKK